MCEGQRREGGIEGLEQDRARIRALFAEDAPLAVAIAAPAAFDAPLHPDEAAAVAGAVTRRRREFAAGRDCARRALAALGGPAGSALPAGPSRAPRWPPGYVGAITHCDGFCCAVVARSTDIAALGVDAESAGRLEPPVARRVLTAHEAAALELLAPSAPWPTLAFSAKEAVYKCLHPLTATPLDFQDVEIAFWPNGAFTATPAAGAAHAAKLSRAIEGRWSVDAKRVYAGALLRIAPAPFAR